MTSESEGMRDSRMAVLAKNSSECPQGQASAGKCVPNDPRHSEGEVGHNARSGRKAQEGRVLESVSTKLQRITEMAKRDAGFVFTNLMHQIDEVFLWEAHRLIRKDGASGVDGETAEDYAKDLSGNIRRLHRRMKSGGYKAPPVKRAWVPKDDNELRPIGIPAFEDKIVQKSVAMVLGAIYEVDFLNCSHGFRPERSAHGALSALRQSCFDIDVTMLIDADIQGYFDAIDHEKLIEILSKRVKDGTLLRFIGKWLKAGVMENAQITYMETGTPQGGIISPLLANIYLHEVLDKWFEEEVRPVMYGRCFLIRYADDFVIGFANIQDAKRVMDVLGKRFSKYGLTIHPDKTRCLRFERPRGDDQDRESFDFLGFTHYWGKSRKGNWIIKRRTGKKRQCRAIKRIRQWCKEHMHDPLVDQWKTLVSKLRGHYQYYGIIGNYKQMELYYEKVEHCWRGSLNRRNTMNLRSAQSFRDTILKRYPLPIPRIMKSV